MHYVLIHLGEIVLKKGNRDFFEKILQFNLKEALKGIKFSFYPSFGRLCLEISDDADVQEIESRLKKVFGIANFSFALRCEQEFEEFSRVALEEAKKLTFQTFCVRVRRVQKNFPKTSVELEREIGAYLLRNGIGAGVDVHRPEVTVQVDLVNKDAFVSVRKIAGAGGLPTGSTGRSVSLLSSGIDSPVASFRIMKRGAKLSFVHFHSYPFTDAASQDNVREIVKILNQYQYHSKIYFVPFGNFQKIIMTKAPMKLRVILYRRAMMQIAERIARRSGALSLVTGESLGQVASQTMENLFVTNSAVSLSVFRPLIGMDKEEIIQEARKIGTYDISTQPYGDCCSLFVPTHPETKAKLEDVKKIEEALNFPQLIEEVFQGVEVEVSHF